MSAFLAEAARSRLRRVLQDRRIRPEARLRREAGPPGKQPPGPPAKGFVVAEIKRASPSRGPLDPVVKAASRAALYAGAGAGAVSVLREPDFFLGSLEDVRDAARTVSIPVLYKDFVVDPYQLLEARWAGASWVLLIARLLEGDLPAYIRYAQEEGLLPLVEVHREGELEAALEAGASFVGINARDLETLEVDPGRVRRLLPRVPPPVVAVAESGIASPAEVAAFRRLGARGFLVGEALMRSPDPAGLLREMARAAEAGP
ncbi:MAG: indole-3-glycerol-phosphate synthase [Acidobacteriota bacterium]